MLPPLLSAEVRISRKGSIPVHFHVLWPARLPSALPRLFPFRIFLGDAFGGDPTLTYTAQRGDSIL